MSGDGLGARLSVGKSGSTFAELYARLLGVIMQRSVERRGDPLIDRRRAEEEGRKRRKGVESADEAVRGLHRGRGAESREPPRQGFEPRCFRPRSRMWTMALRPGLGALRAERSLVRLSTSMRVSE